MDRIPLFEPDTGERFSRNQTKILMMASLGAAGVPERDSRGIVRDVMRFLDDDPAKRLRRELDGIDR